MIDIDVELMSPATHRRLNWIGTYWDDCTVGASLMTNRWLYGVQ
jgi:hypothetical protein